MPLSVFRLRNLRAANLVIFLLYAAIFGFWFFQSLYMQGTLHYSALETGLAFVPMTVAVGTGATLAPRLATPRRGAVGAGRRDALRDRGRGAAHQRPPGGSYLANVLPGGMLGAFGLGLALVPATIVAVQGVPRALSGLASGVLNTSRFIGAALGLAVLSTIAANHTHRRSTPGPPPPRRSPTASSSSSASARSSAWWVSSPRSSCCARSASASPPRRWPARSGPAAPGAEGEAVELCRTAACDRDLMAKPALPRPATTD